ncbi:substrate-binding domain-containing protein [Azohydromonas australica]|uniref:substrate-binding domain-containing protein n=1 Tax=Azohydromonas australica TaxID=364039 RepID=UPI00040C602C|nr:substrate-binding domain-containing protein [Azohydromonas australica]
MCSASDSGRRALAAAGALAAALALAGCAHNTAPQRADDETAVPELRVCADPNNLPFSNERGEGFENAIARLIAEDLGARLSYAWWPQRRGFVRNTLGAGRCDLVIGVPARYELTATTRPYYRSTYVFVTRGGDVPGLQSFDDPRLRELRIGAHVVGDDYSSVPPVQALVARHIVGNVYGYSIYGNYAEPDPPRRLIDAVANGEVDVGLAWGPLAGYFAQREPVALQVTPVAPQRDAGGTPMYFDIAMGVRRGDLAWRERVQQALDRQQPRIEAVLSRYGVPMLPLPSAPQSLAQQEAP